MDWPVILPAIYYVRIHLPTYARTYALADCNANRPYQPDLVLDVKLFGKRN